MKVGDVDVRRPELSSGKPLMRRHFLGDIAGGQTFVYFMWVKPNACSSRLAWINSANCRVAGVRSLPPR